MINSETQSFSCSETFIGGTKTDIGSIENVKTFRFKVVKNQSDSFDCIPEYYSEKSEKWIKCSPGWNVENVIGSTGLYLNFGSNQVIIPTESVWDEIRQRLKSDKSLR